MRGPIILKLVVAFFLLFVSLRSSMELGKRLGGGYSLPADRSMPPTAPDWVTSAIESMNPDASIALDSVTQPFMSAGDEWLCASYRTFRDGEWHPEYRSFRRSAAGMVASWPIVEE